MLKNIKFILTLTAAFVGISTSTYVINTNACPKNYCIPNAIQPQSVCPKHFFLMFGTGYSFSRDANISALIGPGAWATAAEGYDANIGNSVLYNAGAGYQFSRLVAVDFEVTRRPQFNYTRFQTPTTPLHTPTNVIGPKTRYFDLANTSVMANTYLYGSGVNWFINIDRCTILQPFIGAGIGISYNKLSNFHSVLTSQTSTGANDVATIMEPNTVSAFAWQAMAGLEVLGSETWGIDLGYRYFDGGQFKSNNYIVSSSTMAGPFAISPWSGRLTANEVFVNFKYMIA